MTAGTCPVIHDISRFTRFATGTLLVPDVVLLDVTTHSNMQLKLTCPQIPFCQVNLLAVWTYEWIV
jgi:hypothetical protein